MNAIGRSADPFRPILEVGAALVSSPLAGEALQNVAAAIGEAMNVASVDIQAYVAERDCLVERAVWTREGVTDDDRAYIGIEIPLAERPAFRPIIEERRVVEAHVDDPDLPPEERAAFERWGYKTTLDMPLAIGDRVLGVIGVAETRFVRRFLSMEIDMFERLAGMAAAAMRNAELFRSGERDAGRLDGLLAVVEAARTEPTNAVLAAGARACREALEACRVTVSSDTAGDDAAAIRADLDDGRSDRASACSRSPSPSPAAPSTTTNATSSRRSPTSSPWRSTTSASRRGSRRLPEHCLAGAPRRGSDRRFFGKPRARYRARRARAAMMALNPS